MMTKPISREKVERSRLRLLATLFVVLPAGAALTGCGFMEGYKDDKPKPQASQTQTWYPSKRRESGNVRKPQDTPRQQQDVGGGGGGGGSGGSGH